MTATDFSSEDCSYMREALSLAEKGRGICSPDPMVGAVVVNRGEVVGRGYHLERGTPHGEAVAIRNAGERARGGTLYLNLEPCCHWGYNPPCTQTIIEAGIQRVVAAMRDPNPLVRQCDSGKILKQAGITIEYGCLEHEAQKLNEAFCTFITTGKPFVTLKIAVSLDGKIATHTGDSKWITSSASRQYVHSLRAETDVIVTGIGTVLRDDPQLTARDLPNVEAAPARQPVRVIIDSNANIPYEARVLGQQAESRTIVAVTEQAPAERLNRLEQQGIGVIRTSSLDGRVDLKQVLAELGKRSFTSVLIEAGGTLNASFLAKGLVDKVLFFVAPVIIGGSEAPTAVEGPGVSFIRDAARLKNLTVRQIGSDTLIEGYL